MSTINKSSEFKKGIKAFIQHVQSLESSDDGFIDEYTMIQKAQMRDHRDSYGSMDVGKLEHNLKKNRYKDIVPYDEFRIVLSKCEGDECSDYINASKIMGVSGAGDYIASQGPLLGTVNDFWRMIWEYDVEIVFMACRLMEMEKVKCSQYWADVGSSAEFGSISVSTVSEQEIFTECIQRVLRVTNGDEVHQVTQLHYCGWPDHGIPENPDDIRDIIGIMRSKRQNYKAPILVHCSAGCGRTGTIIAIDYVWTLLENGKFDETFSLFDLICNLRKQRVSLVQTPDQYALVNKVLKSLCEDMLAKIASHTYENVQFNEEQPNEESIQQTSEENVYEDIWSQDKSSEEKASVLSPKECKIVTEERHLGGSDEVRSIMQPSEKEEVDTLSLYANSDELIRKVQDDRVSQVQPSDISNNQKIVHKTLIRLDSTTGAAVTQVNTLDNQISPGNATTSAVGSSGLQRGSSVVVPSRNSEVNATDLSTSDRTPGQKHLSYRGSKRATGDIVVSTAKTMAALPSTQNDISHSSTLKNTDRIPQTQPRLLSSTEISTVSGLKTFTQPSLPVSTNSVTERSLKTLPRLLSTAEDTTERNSQTPSRLLSSTERSTVSGSKTLAQTSLPASTKSFTERSLKTMPRSLSTAESTTDRNFWTPPQSPPSNYSTADKIRRHFQTVTSKPAQIQKPQEKTDKHSNNKRWSSVKSSKTSTQTTTYPAHYDNVVISTQSGRSSIPATSASVKVSTGNKVYDFPRQPENRRVIARPVQGARGIHSNTLNSEIQAQRQAISNPRGTLQDIPDAGPPTSPKYKGFVLLTPRDTRSGASRGEQHK